MPDEADPAVSLCEAIVNGTFPQSEDLLTADLASVSIPRLLEQISETRRQISDEIRAVSKDDSGDVGRWMLQAKKVQEDIARCKLESKRIVEEHEQLQALQDEAIDYQRKVELLEAEIEFTGTLRRELQNISQATQSLRDVEDYLAKQDLCAAATKLQELDDTTATILRSRTATLIRDLKDELRLKTRVQLEARLYDQISVRREPQKAGIEVLPTELDANSVNSGTFIKALNQLGDSQESLEPLIDKLRAVVLQPLRQSSRLKLAAYNVSQYSFNIELNGNGAQLDLVFQYVLDFIQFLHSSLSPAIQPVLVRAILPELITILVDDWLNYGLPTDLSMLEGLDIMQQQVKLVLEQLRSLGWEGQTQLENWMDDIHRAWLNKRKAATLDAVRRAFTLAKGTLRQVERVERQVLSTAAKDPGPTQDEASDWDANWDDDNRDDATKQEPAKTEDEEEVSGWGFEDEEDETDDRGDNFQRSQSSGVDNGNSTSTEEGNQEDAGDAWGWGDDSPEEKKEEPKRQAHRTPTSETPTVEQEVTLTEVYSISEIPDHIVEIIGRDVTDAQSIQQGTQHKSLDSSAAAKGLLALPTLALAMFRAIAPSYYGASPSLTDLHRYNDSLYIAERLREMQTTSTVSTAMPPQIETDIKTMERFARLAYSKEMETQRLIIWDLLEGAQGFVSSTQFPYSQEIENAVSAVVDRIRALHLEWKPILSTSALMQSIGSLLTMVVSKVISSIEDMDDISEPESRRLTALCQQIATLDDLFLSTPPAASHHPEHDHDPEPGPEPIPMTAVYVPNWLRFHYLINILESSLVDIKYLWTEGELSLEFSEDEVVDLIKALFAESAHRRNAIAAIKGSRRTR